jgi:hypothetical protein
MQLEFRGKHLEFLNDPTPEILVEGSLSSGKSTVGIWKELDAADKYPGIWILITRWTDDAVKTLLKPAIEQLARIKGLSLSWNNAENYYALENGSRIFAFGLKTQSSDPLQKYAKIRGLPVSRILFDQAEQGPKDVVGELRFRLRPDIEARLKGIEYPRQLTFLANPVNDSHVLATDFPDSSKIQKNRKLYQFSLLDAAHVLPKEMVDSLLSDYPPEHPLFNTRIMGQRGLTIIGDAVYENLFDRTVHVKPMSANGPLIEAFEIGKHNPVWIIGQRTFHGGLVFLGGLLSKRSSLDDFLSAVKHYRSDWFGALRIRTCTGPTGEIGLKSGNRYTLVNLLRAQKFRPVSKDFANAPDVQLAMIEEISARLRRRVALKEEAIIINADPSHWLQMLPDGSVSEKSFLSFAFEGGYTWDEHTVSVSNKELRQPREDDEYANAMHCIENLVLNFCVGQKTDEERKEQRILARGQDYGDRGRSQDPQSWLAS